MADFDSDSDSELLPRAFVIAGEANPCSGPPTTGEEYLKQVRWEAKRCPNTIISNIDPRKFDSNQTVYFMTEKIPDAPTGFAPSKEWENEFLKHFAQLQKRAEMKFSREVDGSLHLPAINDPAKWFAFCFGNNQPQKSVDSEEDDSTQPLVSVLSQLDTVSISTLLKYHVRWLDTETLTEERACWLFSLLVRTQKPLLAEESSLLRRLLRRLCTLRAALPSKEDPILPSMNILITTVAKYFDQGDKE